jgi:hypothetical protein
MTTNQEMVLNEAIRLADKLTAYVPESDRLEVIWESSESKEALRLVQDAGYSPDEFLEDVNLKLNASVSDFSKRFYQSYIHQISTALCNKDSDLRQAVGTAIGAGTSSLITVMAAQLLIPSGAVVIVAPIAAILLVKGIDAFCEME